MPTPQVPYRSLRWILAIAVLEIFNASYLAAFDTASIFYHVNVVLHVVLGIPLAAAILFRSLPALLKSARKSGGPQGLLLRTLAVVALVFVGSGLVLAWTGASRPYYALLKLHVATAIMGGALLLAFVWAWARRPGADGKARAVFRWNFAVLGIALALPLMVRGYRSVYPEHVSHIVNPPSPPLTAMDEGGGPDSPFFPSSNETRGTTFLPSDFFLDSKRSCGTSGCHPDIADQWDESMHHFSSFNNQWYRKSIEYMQDTIGTRSSKWCGGCHDMAILLTGKMDTPIREQIDTPEAQAGIGCLVCHSIVHVKDTMGQGGFVLEYPEMHHLASSESPIMKALHDYMTRLDPQPHRKTMLKPFHRESSAEFCSACHKVHLDKPINNYRWFRGFNEYDAWQQSGVSGQGARSFYYPPASQTCSNCHMPLVPSDDAGNIDGMVHSHRFPAANTALPFVNGDEDQMKATVDFLRSALTIDIFGLVELEGGTPTAVAADGEMDERDESAEPRAASLFPGESGVTGRPGEPPSKGRLIAPLPGAETVSDQSIVVEPGREYLVEVVARTRNVGHMFPGGTVDAFDVWIELKAEDENGGVVFWSGWLEPEEGGRKGPVDPSAHFYRSLLIDAHGNPINKRNAWAARALLYARTIPPGAADTAHFRLRVPESSGGALKLTARMNYRKFAWWNTQWAYAGIRDPDQPDYDATPHYDDGRWVFEGDTSDVSGPLKEIPDLPIIELASDIETLTIGATPSDPEALRAAAGTGAKTRERFNDYGIGLLRQGDLKGAADAFRIVTELDPGYADGFVNIARAQIQEGSHREARATLEKALSVDPDLPKTHYFYALTLKTEGRYDEAIEHLERTLQSYPRDRVVLNQLGTILFLQRKYERAIDVLKRTLAIDPEDLKAHYIMMLCYRGLGDEEQARREEILYTRFKADEPSQELTGARRRLHPEENNERQLIHEHVSTWPGAGKDPSAGYTGQ